MKLIQTTLVGIGQIFLQENGLSGLLIAIGMFFSGWTLGAGCLLGSLIGTLTARAMRCPEAPIRQGLYGFNASLCLMCTLFTFGLEDAFNPAVWLLGAAAAVVSTLIMHACLKTGKTAFTFPFVLTCWLFCWGVAQAGLFGLSQTAAPTGLPDLIHAVAEPLYAFAAVNFGFHPLTGLFILLAIALNSPVSAVYGMAAASLSGLAAHFLFGIEPSIAANGLYSFSAVLVACVFAGSRFIDFLYAAAGTVLALAIQHAFTLIGLPAYTIGFIAASWIMLAVKKRLDAHAAGLGNFSKILNP